MDFTDEVKSFALKIAENTKNRLNFYLNDKIVMRTLYLDPR